MAAPVRKAFCLQYCVIKILKLGVESANTTCYNRAVMHKRGEQSSLHFFLAWTMAALLPKSDGWKQPPSRLVRRPDLDQSNRKASAWLV